MSNNSGEKEPRGGDELRSIPFGDVSDFFIPEESIQRWNRLPVDARIEFRLKRREWDRFFFLHMHLLRSVVSLQEAVIQLSKGEIEDAQQAMDASFLFNGAFEANLRAFMAQVMDSAQEIGEEADAGT